MSVIALGYVGFEVRDTTAWAKFATQVLGMMPTDVSGPAQRYRIDSQAWRVAVEPGDADDIVYAGFEVAGSDALNALAERLAAAGLEVIDAPPQLLAQRGVIGLKTVRDPGGLAVELHYGATQRHEVPFVSPAGVSSFVTAGQGLGHIVLATHDIAASRHFFGDLLGFQLSDIITMRLSADMAIDIEFFHCNSRHHTLALAPIPSPQRLNHFMLQAAMLDDVGFALERAGRMATPVTQSLGRHSNDAMVSFYARTPSGFEVEFGFGAIEVDAADWRVQRHEATSIWGHKRTGA